MLFTELLQIGGASLRKRKSHYGILAGLTIREFSWFDVRLCTQGLQGLQGWVVRSQSSKRGP